MVRPHIWIASLIGLGACTGVLSEPGDPAGSSVAYVFATHASYLGMDLHGLAGADQICATAAAEAGLDGTFKAWLSDAFTSAAARLSHATMPYTLVNGKQVAAGFEALVNGKLEHAIDLDEHGFPVLDSRDIGGSFLPSPVWTATEASGEAIPWNSSNPNPTENPRFDCGAWGTDPQGGQGVYGDFHATTDSWTNFNNIECDVSAHLYCLEQ